MCALILKDPNFGGNIFSNLMKLMIDLEYKMVSKKNYNSMLFSLQGASATYPSFYCDISQSKLKDHGKEAHNFNTVKCCLRTFDSMKGHLQDQIEDLDEDLSGVDDICDYVFKNDRNEIERKFRDRGKHHKSVIAKVNSGIESMEYALGGELHNEIGLSNDCIENLCKDLKTEKMETVCETIKTFLDSPKSADGAGCSPGQHHGGQYNGEHGH